MQASTSDHLSWRDKYYGSLDALERREREWDAVEQTLYRSLSRVALTAYGVDAGLDRRIDALREGLRARRGPDRVAALVARVEETAERRGHRGSTDSRCAQAAHPPSLVSRLLTSRASRSQTKADVGPLLELLDRLHRAGTLDARPSRASRRRLEAASADTEQLRAALDALVEELSVRGSDDARAHERGGEVRAELVTVLVQLLEQLESAASPEPVEALRERLASEPEIEEVPDILLAFTALVSESVDAIRSERKEMERFLSGLNHRLDELNDWIDTRAESDRTGAAAREALDESVSANLECARQAGKR